MNVTAISTPFVAVLFVPALASVLLVFVAVRTLTSVAAAACCTWAVHLR